jgi:hypothetical protein
MRSEQAKRYRKDVRNLREILFKDTWKGTRKRAYAVSVFDYDRSTGFQDDVLSGISGAIKLRKGIEEQLGETEAQNYFQLTENYDELLD